MTLRGFSGGCFHPPVKLLQRAFFQPATLRSTDVDLLRHLHLGLAAQISQLHDALFPGAKERLPYRGTANPLIQLSSLSGPHTVDHIHGIAAVGVHRLVKAERLHHRFQRGGHLAPGAPAAAAISSMMGSRPSCFSSVSRLHGAAVSRRVRLTRRALLSAETRRSPDDHRHAVGRNCTAARGQSCRWL